ncbi:hypothetical protein C2845_PM14G10620 [Panicum miliaceum]|uniref:YDG domain-containing protein n=1 Tax=Panicum miliaceum TaxID=4540 RepID=A0A3L6PQQ7_PANMI|nr:hypothetical protein C2845_PM14G10620 [Panicum miliaceum]
MVCSRFESICRAIVQAVERRSLKVRGIDLAADKLIRKLPGFTKLGPVVGDVPGVEVGDEFLYRVELALVGLHRPYQGGIDTTRDETGVLIAISVVASGGYPDELSCTGELIYTGCGGKDGGDQKLGHGNLCLVELHREEDPCPGDPWLQGSEQRGRQPFEGQGDLDVHVRWAVSCGGLLERRPARFEGVQVQATEDSWATRTSPAHG